MTRSALRSAAFVSFALSLVAAVAASSFRSIGLALTVVAIAWIPTLATAIPHDVKQRRVVRAIRVARTESTVVVTTALLIGSFALTGDTALRYLLKDVVTGIGAVAVATDETGRHPAATAATAAWLPAATAIVAIVSVELVVRIRNRASACAFAASVVAAFLVGIQVIVPATGLAAVLVGGGVVACACGMASPAPLRQSAIASTVSMCLAVGSFAALAAAAVPHRATPYQYAPQARELTAHARDPLAMISQRLAHPSIEVFRARPSIPVSRWRVAVLDVVDDGRWTFRQHLKAVRGPISDDPADPTPSGWASAEVTLSEGEPSASALAPGFLPAPARPRRIDDISSVFVEPITGGVYATSSNDNAFRVTWGIHAHPADISDRALFIDPRTPMPVVPDGIARIARDVVAGKEKTIEGALRIAAHLRDTCRLARSPVPGHDPAAIETFLTTTHKGTPDQFAVAFAHLAAASGIPVRVVVGFRQPRSTAVGDWYVVSNGDAIAWAEIHVSGVGWYPIDPTPTGVSGSAAPTTPSATPSPSASASQSHGVVPPRPTTVTPMPPTSTPMPGMRRPSASWALAAVALTAFLASAVVPVSKVARVRRRRRRGGRAGVVAAWHTVLDALLDQRLLHTRVPTPSESAAVVAHTAPTVAAEAAALARHADRALWSTHEASHVLDTAWRASDVIRRSLVKRSIRARWRGWFATASLRQATADRGTRHRGSARRH